VTVRNATRTQRKAEGVGRCEEDPLGDDGMRHTYQSAAEPAAKSLTAHGTVGKEEPGAMATHSQTSRGEEWATGYLSASVRGLRHTGSRKGLT
jgi:hypothetical protein